MTEGYIKLSRGIIDWEWAGDPAMLAVWVHLLARASYADTEWRGNTIHRGEVLISRRKLAECTGLTERQVRTCLDRLKTSQQVTQRPSQSATHFADIITICNFERYQCQEQEKRPNKRPNPRPILRPANDPNKEYILSSSTNVPEDNKEIETNVSTKKDDGSEEFLAFQGWIQTHTPEVAKMQQPFTESQYRSLQQNYTSREVAEVLEDMSNSANLLKKYKSAYLTCKSWLKMRRERRGGMPMAQPQRKPSKVLSMMQEMASAGIDITQPTELL